MGATGAKAHTRGPWEVGQYEWLIQELVDDTEKGEVARVNVNRPEEEWRANARLVARAPLMHEALLEVAGFLRAVWEVERTVFGGKNETLGRTLARVECALAGASGFAPKGGGS